ncbi:MAG: riboflavin biosynthesis protein RibF [Opitutaceae bacterium]|nr:riboflavin biosynthesis protein RibF [Opitutaceae bacterium]
MNLPAQFASLEEAAALPPRPLHLAIGMFDGLHLGHRAVIDPAVRAARLSGGLSGVLTFWPHPSALFRPESPTKLMQPAATKARMLNRLGVDAVITLPFTPELAGIAADAFLPWLKQKLPHLAAIHVGENFRFGRGRQGDAASLVASGRRHGVSVFSTPRVSLGGEAVSSTRIRALLEAGEIEAANALLGYAYFAHGFVTPGKRLGRTIGFPTLNVAWVPELRPRFGVYAVRIFDPGGAGSAPLPAVANYGLRPTVEHATEPRLETHVLGACPFVEGDHVKIEWLRFLRPEMKFGGVAELTAQIARDRAAAEEFFRS